MINNIHTCVTAYNVSNTTCIYNNINAGSIVHTGSSIWFLNLNRLLHILTIIVSYTIWLKKNLYTYARHIVWDI